MAKIFLHQLLDLFDMNMNEYMLIDPCCTRAFVGISLWLGL